MTRAYSAHKILFNPMHRRWKNVKVTNETLYDKSDDFCFTTGKDSDEPVHPGSLISLLLEAQMVAKDLTEEEIRCIFDDI